MKFVDELKLTVSSGKGGPGCVSFRRESKVPRGGPDGGDGGRGGSVVFQVDDRLHSLLDLRFKRNYAAGNGQPGQSSNMSGVDGKDVVLKVPVGTMIFDTNNRLLRDLSENGEEFIYLEGGLGGKGNTYYKSSIHQAPNIAQKGLPGESAEIVLELKLIADVGIIGFPNVGKSTLISTISAAKPKIGDYPFTTLAPNLGVCSYGDGESFVVADIPGLIEGASQGTGLGIQFLKHIERTRFFVHLVDVSSFTSRDPYEDFVAINGELSEYDKQNFAKEGYMPLAERDQLVVFNKIDAAEEEHLKKARKKFQDNGYKVVEISAATRENLKELQYLIGDLVFQRNQKESWE